MSDAILFVDETRQDVKLVHVMAQRMLDPQQADTLARHLCGLFESGALCVLVDLGSVQRLSSICLSWPARKPARRKPGWPSVICRPSSRKALRSPVSPISFRSTRTRVTRSANWRGNNFGPQAESVVKKGSVKKPGHSGLNSVLDGIPNMCHNVHMKTITVRELHMNTGHYVRAAVQEYLVVTDRGRAVAALTKFAGVIQGRSLSDREAWIKKLPLICVDSTRLVSEDRGRA